MSNLRLAYLSTTGSVLHRAASKENGIVVMEEVVIETHVLFLSKDGVVGLHSVLLEKSIITRSLNISSNILQ